MPSGPVWIALSDVVEVVPTLLLALVTWPAYVRQRDQHEDLVLRQNLPTPAIDRLR
jgi:hypothetical protein